VKTAAVFMGGGFNGEASAHEWARLWASGFRTTLASGESIGAVNAYCAMAMSPDALLGLWSGLDGKQVFRGGGGLDKVLTAAGLAQGVFDMRPALEFLRALVSRYRLPLGCEVVATKTNLRTGALIERTITRGTPPETAARWIWRSCLVPFAHQTDGVWCDGGVSASAPLGPVVSRGASEVEVILLDTPGTNHWVPQKGAVSKAGRAITILRENLFYEDVQNTLLRNDLAALNDPRFRLINGTFRVLARPLPDFMDLSPEARRARREAHFRSYRLPQFATLLRGLRDEARREAERDEDLPHDTATAG
jgi:NTE family protein